MSETKLLGKRRARNESSCKDAEDVVAPKSKSDVVIAKRSRPNKPDFKPYYTEHKAKMTALGVDIEELIKIRREIHRRPEGGFKEVETQALIKKVLVGNFGVTESCIKVCAKTGLTVDIQGTGPPTESDSGVKMIALRADMDGLPIPEDNPHLEYKSQTDFAHMCGHDGHMATLLGVASALWKKRDCIGSDRTVRLLFQPAEEGPGGAKPMIEEGCLEDVDEVYGYHNIPNFDEGDIRVCEGPFFAESVMIDIEVRGQEGHSSAPHLCKGPVNAAFAILLSLHSIKARNIDSSKNVVFSICNIDSGASVWQVPKVATMKGTMRVYDPETKEKMIKRMTKIAESVAVAHSCTAVLKATNKYPPILNHPEQTNHVIRLAKKFIGEENFSQDELPLSAGEDFSHYLLHKPGCFFTLGTMRVGERLQTLHHASYDYNDNLIPTGSYFFLRIVEDRLGASFFPK